MFSDDDIEYVPIPVDRETRARLVRLGSIVNKHPVQCAAELLADLLADELALADGEGLAPNTLN